MCSVEAAHEKGQGNSTGKSWNAETGKNELYRRVQVIFDFLLEGRTESFLETVLTFSLLPFFSWNYLDPTRKVFRGIAQSYLLEQIGESYFRTRTKLADSLKQFWPYRDNTVLFITFLILAKWREVFFVWCIFQILTCTRSAIFQHSVYERSSHFRHLTTTKPGKDTADFHW